MGEAPPITPGPASPAQPKRVPLALVGMAIHPACVLPTCFGVPLAMNSNIWPIAGVFWSVMTVPVAAGTGALTGWLLRKARPRVAIPILVVTGIVVAIATGVVMANNR